MVERGRDGLLPVRRDRFRGLCGVEAGRQFVGCELKASYWRTAVENLRNLDAQGTLLAVGR